ncbi:hypothetical protein EDB80DRAFT_755383 [Ilyonectria destructans]|nr:hypothetical protein EDB80DRAFT_755383 [Ilyonectria destructans]
MPIVHFPFLSLEFKLNLRPNPTLEAELDVPIIAVDYSNVEALTKALEDNNVHIKEVELIRLADVLKTTKRMISSDWGLPHTEDVPPKLEAQKEFRKTTDLETTCTHMGSQTMVLDIPNKAAAIPGSGNTPVVFIYTADVAKFVVASLDLEKWEQVSYVTGDRVTWNEFLHLAEEAKGTKFDAAYDSTEKLKSGRVAELPGHVSTYDFVPKEAVEFFSSILGLWITEGVFDSRPARTLNNEFPEIETMKVKDILNKAL